MKIRAKISVGYGVLIALILAVLTYQVSLFHQMQSINQDLTSIDFQAAMVSLQLLRDLDQVEEFTRKFFATGGDPGYASQLDEMRNAFAQSLQQLQSLRTSPAEKATMAQLVGLWDQFSKMSALQEQQYHSQDASANEENLADQLDLFNQLRVQAQSVIRATRLAIGNQVQNSYEAAKRAQRISWLAAGAALLLSLIVSLWIIRSISGPLRSLTEGTRAVAEGKFFYKLETRGKDELAQLARDFDAMTDRLSELDSLKKDFVSHVSHELKTPLASVEETIRLLLEEIPGPLNAQQKRFLELNLQSTKRLSGLIRNLLDLSRMEAGVMHYEMKKHDFAALIRTSLGEFEAPFREKSFKVKTNFPGQPVAVACDADRIAQVLGNLLGNAVKFSPPRSTLSVQLAHVAEMPANVPPAWRDKVAAARNGEGFALLSVADNGPGIPAGEREKVFEKFYQVRQGLNTAGQGTGLGLAIGRTIVEAHRGAIWVEDNPGGGSIFYLLLTAGAVGEPATVRTSSPI